MHTVETGRVGEKMRTYSGGWFWPLDPRALEVKLLDIAHHLAMLCRWTGAVRSFYSVAQHSVLVSREVPPELKGAALLHDAAEAYLGDDARPMKPFLVVKHPTDAVLKPLKWWEINLERTIFDALGVPWPDAEGQIEIKIADNLVLATEARDLFDHCEGWSLQALDYPKAEWTITPQGPAVAEQSFISAWRELRR